MGLLSTRLREKVATRRVLIVLDGVVGPAIAEVFRFHAPGSLVVLISRDRWDRLPGSYVPFEIQPLKDQDAAELAELRFRRRGIACTPRVADAIVRGTGGMPQLIAVGAETLAGLPAGSEELVLRFVDAKLVKDWGRVFRQMYDSAYDQLSTAGKRAYRLLSLHPLPELEFSVDAAMALLGTDFVTTVNALTELRNKNLLTTASEGYRFHSSVWRDAATRRDEVDSPDVQQEAVGRMLLWYLEKAVSYELVLSDRWRVLEIFQRVAAACDLADRVARERTREVALAWLERNLEILVQLVLLAHDRGFDREAVAFGEALWSVLHLHNHFDNWRTVHEVALKSAERANLPLPLHASVAAARDSGASGRKTRPRRDACRYGVSDRCRPGPRFRAAERPGVEGASAA
ncbi:NB-ARC domain-containing protein [Fodinicola feengrottensis]|uniref:hypothetical protein n=1 Tax=Fodinicola feengrottensis TaxID=435914 RepID=UPI0013CF6E7B|nr:hypothetical protein [Fodinicola feengrottensis]